MGRDLVLKKITSGSKKLITAGAILGTIFALFAAVLFIGEAPELGIVIAVFALLMFVCVFIGAKKRKNPMSAPCFKLNPKILEQADELYSNIVYQDKFVIYSDRIIANAKDITQMAAFEDIISVTESSSSYNYVSTQHDIVLATAKYQIRISVYAKGRETIDDLKYDIIKRCPNLELKYAQG